MPKTQSLPRAKILEFIAPPFRGAAVIAWIYFIAAALTGRYSTALTGNIYDPDDYLYLAQALDQLNGQGWFDLVQHRMNPPHGTLIPYSHILSGFYAACIFLLRLFYHRTIDAALLMAMIVPAIYLAVFLFAVRRLGQMLVDAKWGDMTAFVLFFSASILTQFTPGHIDHHGLEVLIAVLAFTCMARMVIRPSELAWPVLGGCALAFGLVIGLEMVPAFCFFCLSLGAWSVIEGKEASRSGFVFGLSLLAGSFIFLLVSRPFSQLMGTEIEVYSIAYVVLSGCICVCFAGVLWASVQPAAAWRYVAGGVLAVLSGGFFFYLFPEMKQGPYGGVDPVIVKMSDIIASENWPIIRGGAPWTEQVLPLLWPALAVCANISLILRAPDRTRRWLWSMVFVALTAFTGLSAFYQCRFLQYAQPFSALALTAIICRDWTHRPASPPQRAWRVARLTVLLLTGPLATLMVYDYSQNVFYKMAHAGHSPQQAMVPNETDDDACDMHALADILNDPQRYGGTPHIVMNTVNEGPELLFRTGHVVLSAPLHTNIDGNLDAFRFFATGDPDEARAIAKRRHADLVVVCAMPSQVRVYRSLKNDIGTTGRTFIDQLISTKIPAWLKPVPLPQYESLMLFEVR